MQKQSSRPERPSSANPRKRQEDPAATADFSVNTDSQKNKLCFSGASRSE
jgi:hypothetical protein